MAVLSSFAYARTRVRQGRTGQRVRLGAVITATAGATFNLTRKVPGEYGRTSERAGSPYFAWSSYGTPPLAHDVAIPAPTCTEARFAWQPGGRIILSCNNSGAIEHRASDDDGLSWNLPETGFASASHPDLFVSRTGILVALAYRAGEIVGTRQTPAGAAASAEFTLKDAASADIAVEDDVFRLVDDGRGWWWIHLRLAGGGETALLFSTDIDTGPTETFALTSGAVTGITSGEHPGMCVAEQTGTLYAWALVGTSGWITHRHPGSVDWADPIEMVDVAGDPLEFADQPFSIASAWEGPDRLILAAVLLGDTFVTELYSSEPEGMSWAPFPGT